MNATEKQFGSDLGGCVVRQAQQDLPKIQSLVEGSPNAVAINLPIAYGWAAALGAQLAVPEAIWPRVHENLLAYMAYHLAESRDCDFNQARDFVERRVAGYDDAARPTDEDTVLNVAKYFWACCHYGDRPFGYDDIQIVLDRPASALGEAPRSDRQRRTVQSSAIVTFCPDLVRDRQVGMAILAFAVAARDVLEDSPPVDTA